MKRGSALGLAVAGAATGAGVWWGMRDAQSPLYPGLVMPFLTSRFLDPEVSHRLAVKSAALGLTPVDEWKDDPRLGVTVWGRHFEHPLGLAAGFDKNAEAMEGMLGMGFAFVEVGSVCLKPQPGNPKPRVFRLFDEKAIINRYGFNSDGVLAVAERLDQFRERQKRVIETAADSAKKRGLEKGVVGVNFGKNKDRVMGGTDGEGLGDDYVELMQRLSPYADYLVINISSPNTPNLRLLQSGSELQKILEQVMAEKKRAEAASKSATAYPPVLIKIAPDLTKAQAEDIAAAALKYKVDGIIVSNTTVSRPLRVHNEQEETIAKEAGGLSGRPLLEMSTQLLRDMYRLTEGRIPLIGVGGISSGKDAYDKIKAGASLVQLYTGLVYEGPGLVGRVKKELVELLDRDGFRTIEEAVGHDHHKEVETK
ncbi:dihydroorotate oxidase [Acanthamoeba castellanii str. Neff]|uniref:Dihydroorotate dehydrogenase (quinone), mitochondrial n=1 Tax=Acanthamoeba castellanii (strain ATCC 30010 / Neff) TaxID=1257118 RepID=L8GWX2_ACACF|nr:dihydroorotate oxidase [Acanthamoeba castellanii str. Neff]ELR17447.1 dihydroorotate oxidase [Acanthamoeba castellanii str. Neff]